MEACKNCRFFAPIESATDQGSCRKNPPTVFGTPMVMKPPSGLTGAAAQPQIQMAYHSNFPSTKPDWWCGEFKAVVEVEK